LTALVVLLLVPVAAEAQEPEKLQVVVDRNQVALGDQVYLTVRIEGSPDEPPRLPELPAFRVVSRGQRRDIQMINGRFNNSTSYNYLLIPTRAGTFEIGPVTARIDNVEVRSRPISIEVGDAGDPGGAQSRDLFVIANVSTDRPWQGQQVLYPWRFYSRVPVGQGSIEAMEFGNDVLAENLGEVRQFQTTLEGVQYSVNELRRALFPQRSGEIVLPPTQLRIDVQVEEARRRQSRRRSLFDDFDSLLGGGGPAEAPRLRKFSNKRTRSQHAAPKKS